jgi:chromate transporter
MSPSPESVPPPPRVPLVAIFFLFLQIGLFSFGGGVLGWLYREVVEKRGWLRDTDFLGGLTVAQVMPGINVTNMAVYIGQRLRGVVGSAVAVVGVLTGPFFFVIGLLMIYGQIQQIAWAPNFMQGVATAAVGLFLSVGIKSIRKNIRGVGHYAVMLGIVVAVGILRWPMVPVVLCLAPVSVALAWFTREKVNA